MESVLTGLVGGLLLLALGWIKHDVNRLADKINGQTQAIGGLSERVARIEGRLDK